MPDFLSFYINTLTRTEALQIPVGGTMLER
jgi:hypothetical protein